MVVESNKDVVRRYVESFNAGNLEALEDVFAADALVQGVLGWGKVKEIQPIWKTLHEGLAVRLEIEDIIAEGDTVAVQ